MSEHKDKVKELDHINKEYEKRLSTGKKHAGTVGHHEKIKL